MDCCPRQQPEEEEELVDHRLYLHCGEELREEEVEVEERKPGASAYAHACTYCYDIKQKCDGGQPCGR